MAEDLVDAIDDEAGPDDVGDGLTKRERSIETSRGAERERKAHELKKQLRKRSLGMLNFRWARYILLIGGIMAIITNFLQVMSRSSIVPPEVGFNNYIEAFNITGGVIYIFPIIAGVMMIVISYFAYTNTKYTWWSLIPGMMLAMAGITVYILIAFAEGAEGQEYLIGEIYATYVPIMMFVAAAFTLLAILLRERE